MSEEETIRPLMDKLVRDVVATAEEDGVISADESSILQQIKVDVRKYEENMGELLRDPTRLSKTGIISAILESAKQVALKDGTITEEEKKLLETIEKYLTNTQFLFLVPKSDVPTSIDSRQWTFARFELPTAATLQV